MQKGRSRFILSFLLPATALYALFVVWPVAQAFVYSLYRWRGVSVNKQFVGLENFRKLAADEVFRQALAHNLLIFVFASAAILALALALAHAVGGETRAARALRAVYLFPQVISVAVVAILWMFLFNPSFGLINAGLKVVGLGRWAVAWLGVPNTALPAVGVAYVWHGLGFYVMLFAAGLKTISGEVYEAARLDGAEGLTRFRRVTWPLLWPVLRVAMVYLVINAMNVFALVYLMTQGGPDRRSEVMLTYLYEIGFTRSEFGLATALAVVNLVVVMLMSGLVLRLLGRDPQEGAALQEARA